MPAKPHEISLSSVGHGSGEHRSRQKGRIMKPRATLLTVNHAVTGLLDWQPMIPTGYRIRDQLPLPNIGR